MIPLPLPDPGGRPIGFTAGFDPELIVGLALLGAIRIEPGLPALQQHAALTVRPRLKRRDEKINEQLIPLYDVTGRLFVASDDPAPASQELALQQQEADLKYGVRTINEVRADRGLPPVDWGDRPMASG